MPSSRVRIVFRPSLGDPRSAVLRGVDAQKQLMVPEALRASLGGAETWARAFPLRDLGAALTQFFETASYSTRGDTVTWDASDDDRIDVDVTLPILLLARDLLAMGLDGLLEVGGT